MKRSRINPLSDKQREKNRAWNKITDKACEELDFRCQYCGKKGQRSDRDRWDWLDGHHILLRSRGRIDTKNNCYIAHRHCHQYIHDHNIVVSLGDYETRKYWL